MDLLVAVNILSLCLTQSYVEEKEYTNFSLEESISFIVSNFQSFKREFNDNHDLTINAQGIEKVSHIKIKDYDQVFDGALIDFSGDSGYAIIGPGLTIYNVLNNGDAPLSEIYSTLSGFLCDDSNTVDSGTQIFSAADSNHYSGQDSGKTGCGNIKNLPLYVSDKYGSSYAYSHGNSVSGMPTYSQRQLSCYEYHDIGTDPNGNDIFYYEWEGNCWFVSAYNALQCLQYNNWDAMPDVSTTDVRNILTDEPSIYLKYYDSNGNNKTKSLYTGEGEFFNYQTTLNATDAFNNFRTYYEFPKLYNEVRQYVYDHWGRVNSGSIYNTGGIIETIAKRYGITVDVQEHLKWSNKLDALVDEVVSKKPFIWSVAPSSAHSYGSHTMAGCGYVVYKKRLSTGVFTDVDSKFFLKVSDGHSAGEYRYFDATAFKGCTAYLSFIVVK